MIFVDYVLVAILLVSIVIGALRGFLREAVALVSWIVALFIAWQFAPSLEPHLGAWLAAHEDLQTWVAQFSEARFQEKMRRILAVPAGPTR